MTSYFHTHSGALAQQGRINQLLKVLSNKINNAPKAIQPTIRAKVKHLETVRFDAFTADKLATEIERAHVMVENMSDNYYREQRSLSNSSTTSLSLSSSSAASSSSAPLDYQFYKNVSFNGVHYWDKIRNLVVDYLKKASVDEYGPITVLILNHILDETMFYDYKMDEFGYYFLDSDKTQALYNTIYNKYLPYDNQCKLVWSSVDQFINDIVNAESVSKNVEINTQNLILKLHEIIEQNPDKYINVSGNIRYLKNYEDFTKLIKETISAFTIIPTLSWGYFTDQDTNFSF